MSAYHTSFAQETLSEDARGGARPEAPPTADTAGKAGALPAALAYAARGWRVLPLHGVTASGCGCGRPDCKQAGKHPLTRHGLKDATCDPATIRRWWQTWPRANVAVATGPDSGVWVLGPDGVCGIGALGRLEHTHGPLPAAPRQRTGGGGQHRLFRWPADGNVTNRRNHRGLPIDVRGAGGYFVAAPSANAAGPYEWEVPPDQVEPPEAPAWLLAWVREDGKPRQAPPPRDDHLDVHARAVAYLSKCAPAVSGQGGHNTTLTVARAIVYGFGLGADAGFDLLWQEYNPRCQPPWSEAELRHKCAEAERVPYGKPRGWLLEGDDRGRRAARGGAEPDVLKMPRRAQGASASAEEEPERHLSDLGNAGLLVDLHGEHLRHCAPWRKWLGWERGRWAVDETLLTTCHAKAVSAELFRRARGEIAALSGQTSGGDRV